MSILNDNFRLFRNAYLFGTVASKVKKYEREHPDRDLIRMDVGDVTLPLCPEIIKYMHRAVDDLSNSSTFMGYGPEYGYKWLRAEIADKIFEPIGIQISPDEVFVSDGANSDLGNIGDLFTPECRVALQDPSYPVYIDASLIDGRAGNPEGDEYSRLTYLDCTAENNFFPAIPEHHVDLIYLCSPNNPTGGALTRDTLAKWIDYARREKAVILYDAAYEAFIRSRDVAHSIYEIDGAREVAIEFRSFSKSAGFTGLRCGYCIVPFELKRNFKDGSEGSLNAMWKRRVCTKFNGPSYVSQRAALGALTKEAMEYSRMATDYYLKNAGVLRDSLSSACSVIAGGIDSPYVWAKAPDGMESWEFFDYLLANASVSCTPGSGFGNCGKGYIRFTGFNTAEKTLRAAEAISTAIARL